jgi:MFS family permease
MPQSATPGSNDRNFRSPPWALVAILGCEFFWGAACAVANLSTVVTGYIEWLAFPQVVVALVPALYWASYCLAQPLSLRLTPSTGNVSRRVVFYFLAGSLQILILGTVLTFVPLSAAARALLVGGCHIAFTAFVGIGDPQYVAIVYRAVPDHQRGRFWGIRSMAFGLGGVLGSLGVDMIFVRQASPERFHTAFLVSGMLFLVAVASFALYRDRNPEADSGAEQQALSAQLGGVVKRILANRPLLVFLLVEALLATSFGGFALYAGYIRRTLGETERVLGPLTQALWVSNCVVGPVIGWWGDRFGYRTAMMAFIGCFALGTILLVWPHGSFWYYLVAYFLTSVWVPGIIVVSFNLAQACAGDLRPAETMVAMSVALMPIRLLSPVLIGWLMDMGLASAALSLCAALAIAAVLVLVFYLKPKDVRQERLSPLPIQVTHEP